METGLKIDVAALDDSHRRALEEVIGRELTAKQQVRTSHAISAEYSSNAVGPLPE
jgi:hypothetical protein